MLLAIDVGNTQTVVGIYQDGSLQYRWRVATNKSHTSDELRVKLVPLLASEGLKLDDVRGVRWPRWCPRSPWHGARPRIA